MKAVRSERPNVVLIMSDQHHAGVMGCAGDPVVETPNLDALAARGVMLGNLYCNMPLCAPSRASFLTGLHPYETGVLTNDIFFNSAQPTFAHALGAVGYRPHLIGKLHAMGVDQLVGYASREVGDHGPHYPGVGGGVDRGVLKGTQGPHRVSLEKSGPGRTPYQAKDENVAAAAMAFLERYSVDVRFGVLREPFFLNLGLMLPHQPFVAMKADYDRYEGKVGPPAVGLPDYSSHPYDDWWRRATGIEDVTPAEVIRARTAYWALVHRMDAIIGEVLEALDRTGLASNTLVVYTSDHGEQVGEHGLWWKQTLYEGAAKVPGILTWPGVLPEGVRSEHVCSLLDIHATLLDACQAPRLPRASGRTLVPSLTEGAPWLDEVFAEYCVDPGDYGRMQIPPEGFYQRMVRKGRFKLIYHLDQPAQLFDLEDDPGETVNRAEDPALSDTRRELQARVFAGWDPIQVRNTVRVQKRELEVFRDWAQHMQPENPYQWHIKPEMSALDLDD